jgi:hypothetical protein
MNNIGTISIDLSTTIGGTTTLSTQAQLAAITMINGTLVVGCMLFDPDGTIGVCDTITQDQSNNNIYTIRTCAVNGASIEDYYTALALSEQILGTYSSSL